MASRYLPTNSKFALIFDERKNWKNHIKDVKAKAARKLNIIKSLAHTHRGADQKTLFKNTPHGNTLQAKVRRRGIRFCNQHNL
jgi:hypothetical protein